MSEKKLNHVKSMPWGAKIFSEIDKYIVSFFFDDKGSKLSLLNYYLFVFLFLVFFS